MAEVKTQGKVTPQHVDKGTLANVVKIVGQGKLALEFITAAKNFTEALARGIFRDEAQKNAVIIYNSHLKMFDMLDELDDLTNFLVGTCSIGGYNRSASIMDDTGIYTPAGLGIKDSKEHEKAIKELREERNKSGNKRNE